MRIVAAVSLLALAFAVPAAADPAPPTVTLLGPPEELTIHLDGRENVTFLWRIDFPQAPSGPTTITFEASSDPSFQAWKYNERFECSAATPACFTSVSLHGRDWLEDAFGGAPFPESEAFRVYWRVRVQWGIGLNPVVSAPGSLTTYPLPPDTTAPRLGVHLPTIVRGEVNWAWLQAEDDRDTTLRLGVRLSYRGRQLVGDTKEFENVTWGERVPVWFLVPTSVSKSGYRVCFTAADTAGNTTERCTKLRVR